MLYFVSLLCLFCRVFSLYDKILPYQKKMCLNLWLLKKAKRVITLNGLRLPWSSNEKYLGIELDSRMTFTKQANNTAAISKKNINAMKSYHL